MQKPVLSLLGDIKNIHLIPPVDYLQFIYLMNICYLILTDSGGVQEEAPSLGKPVLVMRDKTERPEAVESGVVRLVGTSSEAIVRATEELIHNKSLYNLMSQAQNPYGDGRASQRIVGILSNYAMQKQNGLGINTDNSYYEKSKGRGCILALYLLPTR